MRSRFRAQSRFYAMAYSIDFQRIGGHLRAKDPCTYLGKGNVTRRRSVICEWRKSAIVSGPELLNRDVPCRLQNAISYEFWRLDRRIQHIDHPDKYPLAGAQNFLNSLQHSHWAPFAGELYIEVSNV